MKSNVVDIIIIIFIVVLLSSGLGLIIVQTVDNRLSNISINMPEIIVPPAKVVLEVNNELPNGLNIQPQTKYRIKPKNKSIKVPEQQGAGSESPMCKNTTPRHFDSKLYRSESKKINKPKQLTIPTDTAHKKSLPAPYPSQPETTEPLPLPLNNTSSIQYYKNPEEMTVTQKYKFKTKAKFNNMTIKDYTNWLQLYRDDVENLSKHNRKNLKNFLKGQTLNVIDIPKDELIAPPTASSNYEKLTGISQKQEKIHHDTDVQAANYDDFEQFMPPVKMKHLSHFNPDTDDKFNSPFLSCMRPTQSRKNNDT